MASSGRGSKAPLRSGSVELSARKRLSRKSPGPELRKSIRSIPPPSNVVGPETVSYIINKSIHKFIKFLAFSSISHR